MLDATIAYALNRKGDLRPAITQMRRAYPQFMAHGGEALPPSILQVIFPIDHWTLITKYATARKLDPYLLTALIAQESTFQEDVRSVANAYGLMQIVPATGRRYASSLGIRPFRTTRLTEAETNVRIGTAYFADLLQQFGNVAPALAAYNAGEHRVARWLAERPGIDQDEFIDDIPFPETQNYVKRIIGTAEDYRNLYPRAQR
jgi:soluble lytic murein transglycosylase